MYHSVKKKICNYNFSNSIAKYKWITYNSMDDKKDYKYLNPKSGLHHHIYFLLAWRWCTYAFMFVKKRERERTIRVTLMIMQTSILVYLCGCDIYNTSSGRPFSYTPWNPIVTNLTLRFAVVMGELADRDWNSNCKLFIFDLSDSQETESMTEVR